MATCTVDGFSDIYFFKFLFSICLHSIPSSYYFLFEILQIEQAHYIFTKNKDK